MQISEWKAIATAAKLRNPKSLPTFRPASPKAEFGPRRPVNRFDEKGRSEHFGIDTSFQFKLEMWANKILGASGFFEKKPHDQEVLVDAYMIGITGLKPLWHGRA